MTLDRMHHLWGLIPNNASFISSITGNTEHGADADADLWATIRNEPRFAFIFVSAFLELDKFLPPEVDEDHLWQLFLFRRYRKREDRDALEACALLHPSQKVIRTIIQCLLLHPQVKVEWISEWTGYSVRAICLYHEWFFNVRERTAGRDDAYVLSLVFPQSRQVEFTYNYHLTEDWVHIAYRTAYTSGIMPMLRWMGSRPMDSELTGSESMRAFEARISSGGRCAMEFGFQHQPGVLAISNTRHLLQSSKIGGQEQADDDFKTGFGALSMSASAQLVIKQITQRSSAEKLRAGQMLDVAIEEQNRVMAEKKEKAQAIPV